MRKCKVFVGTSHPELGNLVCEKLGVQPAPVTLKKFANGETSVSIGVSVRDEDVYIIQSGSPSINDHIMELLILISACKSGSASKITTVIPQFPYSKQSKMKRHRGAITARMLANLLIMAGADHVVSMDLHASQMQGFFSKPVDNLYGAPILADWIVNNVPDYENAVVVSKNPGGTKRVTALADKLKINFAMIHTDRRRAQDILELKKIQQKKFKKLKRRQSSSNSAVAKTELSALRKQQLDKANESIMDEEEEDETDNLITSSNLQTARVIKGHIVDDDYDESPFPNGDNKGSSKRVVLSNSVSSGAPTHAEKPNGNTTATDGSERLHDSAIHESLSAHSSVSGGSDDDDDDDDFEYSLDQDDTFDVSNNTGVTPQEKLITLVGDVKGRAAIILDDMIDKPNSFIAAAEHCRINCGAKHVYVVATHGVFSNNCLEKMNDSLCIDKIVVTNTYPISKEARDKYEKLIVLDVSPVFAECIRRDHYGESISVLFDNLVLS